MYFVIIAGVCYVCILGVCVAVFFFFLSVLCFLCFIFPVCFPRVVLGWRFVALVCACFFYQVLKSVCFPLHFSSAL